MFVEDLEFMELMFFLGTCLSSYRSAAVQLGIRVAAVQLGIGVYGRGTRASD